MRSLFTVIALAMMTLVGATKSADAAYQLLALIASNETVSLDCRGGDCAAEFSVFCLQPTRASPPTGVRYHPIGGDGITIVGARADGRTVEIPANDQLEIIALRTHNAVRISLPVEMLGALGVTMVALRVGANVSLVPDPIVGDPYPQTDWDIAAATGPLRELGTRLVDNGGDAAIAARMTNDLLNRLPDRGRTTPAVRDTLWNDAAQGWTQRTVTDGARERARVGYEWCRDKVAYGSFFNMRQCLGSKHDQLIGELNNAYWDALKVGS